MKCSNPKPGLHDNLSRGEGASTTFCPDANQNSYHTPKSLVPRRLYYRDRSRGIYTGWVTGWKNERRLMRLFAALAVTALPVWSATQSADTMLLVQVRPEAMVSRGGPDNLTVRIRLAEGAQASLWRAAVCGLPEQGAYTIQRSGVHTIPVSAIPGPNESPVCLASSDGALTLTLGTDSLQATSR